MEGLQTPDWSDSSLQVLPKYNGNIAEISWKTATNPNDYKRRYGYVYDSLNRLMAGFYQNEVNLGANEYYEKITYDLNGNILTLKRNAFVDITSGVTRNIDDLIYTYSGNKLNTVTGSSQDYLGYPDTCGIPLIYDNNGNMTKHEDKGILEIKYNYLNLPNYIKFDESTLRSDFLGNTFTLYRNISTLYRADGAT